MARARLLKPDFWSDKNMVKLSPYARLFFMGMWNFALCDRGHLDDDVEELHLKILPRDPVDPEQLLDELLKLGRVERRQVEGGTGTYLVVPGILKHGKTDERWKTRCPYCPETPPSPPKRAQTRASSDEAHRDSTEPAQTPNRVGKSGLGKDREEDSGRSQTVTRPRHARDLAEPPPNGEPPGPAEKIMTAWVAGLANPPQRRIVADLGTIVAEAIHDGCAPADVGEALTLWQQRPDIGPGVLRSIIHKITNPPTPGAEVVPFIGRAALPRPSTTDQRVREGMALAEHYRAIEAQEAIS